MKQNPIQRFDSILEEIERLVAAHPELEGKDHPEVSALLREGEMILRSEIDPVYREALRDKPEQLAEWDAIMRGWDERATENQSSIESPDLNSSKKELMSDEELSEKMKSILAIVAPFENRQPPDLELEAALEQTFKEMHEVAEVIREKCRDLPEVLPEWQEFVELLEEVEERYREGLEFENSAPEN
ncbi:MAG TPA: hypothetical protein VNG71_15855 [Pyrinomonadaceae bacterium]|nr:hypothetical protein [Pyrinomonadaceae bacterium]